MSKISVEVEMPRFPNYLRAKVLGKGACIPVESLNDDELEQVAENYRRGFIEHAKARRAASKERG